MANRSAKPKGVPVPDDLREQVQYLLTKLPEAQVVARLGVGRGTVARLAAGLTVHAATIETARAGLAAGAPHDPRQLLLPT